MTIALNHSRNAIRELAEAMRAHLGAEGDDRSVLLADFSGVKMASESLITCVDLADANPPEARAAIGASEAIFVVSASDPASLDDARNQAAWLRYILSSLRRDGNCGLLLLPVSRGLKAAQAGERVGLPVCGVLKTKTHIAQVAGRIIEQ